SSWRSSPSPRPCSGARRSCAPICRSWSWTSPVGSGSWWTRRTTWCRSIPRRSRRRLLGSPRRRSCWARGSERRARARACSLSSCWAGRSSRMPLDHPTPLRAAARALRKLYGIEVPEYRLPLLALELEQLGGRGGHEQGLSLLLARDPRAWDRVIDAITVPETYMFRHLGHYLLIRKLAEERVARGRPMRGLCAGCSRGEEAWSAAAVLTTARGRASERGRL